MVKRLKIPKELPEAVIPRRTDNTMVKRLKIPTELPEVVIPRRTDNTIVKRLKIPKELPEAVIPRRTGQQKKYKKFNFWVMVFNAIFNNISVIS